MRALWRLADGFQLGAQALRNRVALFAAVVLVHQVDLQVALLGIGAQVVLAHQAVEGDGRGRARIGLHVAHLGLLGQEGAQSCRVAAVSSSGVPAGMSTTTCKFALVVEGQHLHDHPTA
jgi:hypothetical protein